MRNFGKGRFGDMEGLVSACSSEKIDKIRNEHTKKDDQPEILTDDIGKKTFKILETEE